MYKKLKYNVKIHYDEINSKWDKFIANVPNIHFEQLSVWKEFNDPKLKSFYIYLCEEEDIIVGSKIYFWEYPFVGKVGFLLRGPVFHNFNEKWLALFFKELKVYIQKSNFIYLVVNLPDFRKRSIENDIKLNMSRVGFARNKKKIPPDYYLKCTLLLDLSLSVDNIWKGVTKSRRRNIKKGLNLKYVFREGERKEVKIFYNLMREMGYRRNTNISPNNVAVFLNLWDNYYEKGYFKLFVLEYDNEIICAMTSFTMGEVFRWWKWGWNGKYKSIHLPSLLIWETIMWAKSNGFKQYDFVNLNCNVAYKTLNNIKLEKLEELEYSTGPTLFKIRFGGQFIQYPDAFIIFKNKYIELVVDYLYNKVVGFVFYNFIKVIKFILSLLRKYAIKGK